MVAAFLDGNATTQESHKIIQALSEDAELRELLRISRVIDAEMGMATHECELIPMTAMAATCQEENYCCLECEKHILNNFGIEFDEQQLLENAFRNGWQTKEGTALHNVGRHLENKGLLVGRRYKATVEDIAEALAKNEGVIVAVDGGELLKSGTEELREDLLMGPMPDHTVVVTALDLTNNTITLFDPNSPNAKDIYLIAHFNDAWCDSKNYLVTTSNTMKTYNPRPIDLSDVELSDDLLELREAIAENAHEVWAVERIAQGWSYGPCRDDEKRHTPCLVPYSQLPDSEKRFDREMAMNTIKLLKKLGYDLIKRENTEIV